MMNLRMCGEPPINHYEAIAKVKDSPMREELLALKGAVAGAYANYLGKCPSLETLVALDDVTKKSGFLENNFGA